MMSFKRSKNKQRNRHSKTSFGVSSLLSIFFIGYLGILSTFHQASWFFNWKNIRPNIRDTVRSLEVYPSIPSQSVGIRAHTPRQWHQRKRLMKNATLEELLQLKKHPYGNIRATAYEALILRAQQNAFELFMQAFRDTSSYVYYQEGCISEAYMIGEYLVDIAFRFSNHSPPPSATSLQFSIVNRLSPNERKLILEQYEIQRVRKWNQF